MARLLKIFAVIVIVRGTVLAFAQDQKTVELCSAMAADDPRAPEFLAALVAAHVIIGKGEVADQFTTALERAAGRSVQVNLIVDDVGAKGMEDVHVKRVETRWLARTERFSLSSRKRLSRR